jgi:hypothetical protein
MCDQIHAQARFTPGSHWKLGGRYEAEKYTYVISCLINVYS